MSALLSSGYKSPPVETEHLSRLSEGNERRSKTGRSTAREHSPGTGRQLQRGTSLPITTMKAAKVSIWRVLHSLLCWKRSALSVTLSKGCEVKEAEPGWRTGLIGDWSLKVLPALAPACTPSCLSHVHMLLASMTGLLYTSQ